LIGALAALGSYASAVATIPGTGLWRYLAAAAGAVAAASAVIAALPRDTHTLPGQAPVVPAPRPRVAVRYTPGDATWAKWLTDLLERTNRNPVVEQWDQSAAGSQEVALTVVIVSAAAALWPGTSVTGRRCLYLRVEECPAPEDAADSTVLDLAPLAAEIAAEHVLNGIDSEVSPSEEPIAHTEAVPYPGLDSAVSNVPPRSALFIDRADVLAHVVTVFLGPQQVGTLRSCAVVGVGGVGKTQLALEYAHRFASHYDVIWWIRAESPVSLLDDLTHLARRLGVPRDDDSGVVLGALWETLRVRRRWLLVFDNAHDSAAVASHLPPLTNGDVLVTSYVRSWHGGTVTEVIPLEVFQEEHAVEFLRRRSHDRVTASATAAHVARALGRLPLVLEHAAAYAEETGSTLAQFERVLHQQPVSPPVLSQETWYQPVMTATWRMSLQQACEEEPRSRELALLFAFFASDRIPRALFPDHVHVLSSPLRDHLATELGVNALLRPLLSFSLVRADDDGTLGVSRQIQDFLRSTLQADEHRWYADAASLLLESAFPADPVGSLNWPACAALLPHVLSAVQHGGRNSTTEPLALGRLLYRAGTYLHHRGDYPRARDLLEQALAIWETAPDDHRPELARTLASLGRVQYHLAVLDEARRTTERAVRLSRELYGEDVPRIVPQLLHLSRIQREQWQLGAAEETAAKALELCITAHGENHAARADCLMVLGDVHWRSDALDAAQDCYLTALTLRERLHDSRPGELATGHKHLAIIALERDVPEEAAGHLVQARTLLTSVYEEDHPDVADVDNHLGDALRRLGRTDEARVALEHALKVRSRLGDHPDGVGTLIGLGRLDRDTDELTRSAEHLEEARRMASAAMGPNHPYVANAEHELAETLFTQGHADQAIALQTAAVRRYEEAYGHDHTQSRRARSRLEEIRRSTSGGNTPES
jgi:tetratricopeptide (TPR) repeat protein